MLNLTEYPKEIADNERESAKLEDETLRLIYELDKVDADLRREVADNPDLTNETKRKARLDELRTYGRYAEIKRDLDKVRVEKSELGIERARLLREFEIRKLQFIRETQSGFISSMDRHLAVNDSGIGHDSVGVL